jgi:hypothetical protein
VAPEPKKEMETQDERLARIKTEVAAEKAKEIEGKVKEAKAGGLAGKALELYEKALNESKACPSSPRAKRRVLTRRATISVAITWLKLS